MHLRARVARHRILLPRLLLPRLCCVASSRDSSCCATSSWNTSCCVASSWDYLLLSLLFLQRNLQRESLPRFPHGKLDPPGLLYPPFTFAGLLLEISYDSVGSLPRSLVTDNLSSQLILLLLQLLLPRNARCTLQRLLLPFNLAALI